MYKKIKQIIYNNYFCNKKTIDHMPNQVQLELGSNSSLLEESQARARSIYCRGRKGLQNNHFGGFPKNKVRAGRFLTY